MIEQYLPILILIVASLIFAAIALLAPWYLGPRNPIETKLDTYESGKLPYGNARRQVPIHYYKVAMLFIVFDIEVVFLYPWAILLRDLRMYGLLIMSVFFALLVLGLVYEWMKGALEWN